MKHSIIFTTVAAGITVFMALPVIFEVEEPAPAVAAVDSLTQTESGGQPLAFSPESSDGDILPILAGSQKKGNFFTNYAKKAGNFYKKGFDVLTGGARANAQRNTVRRQENGDYVFYADNPYDDYDYYAPAANTAGNTGQVYSGAGVAPRAAADVKQAGGSSTGVKGLYENSLTDIDKVEQKSVYKGVIVKVNRIFPDVRAKKTVLAEPSAEQPAASQILIDDTNDINKYFMSSLPGSASVPLQSGQYAGIASSGQPSAAGSGFGSAFGGTAPRAADISQGIALPDFEKEFARVKSEVKENTESTDGGNTRGIGKRDGVNGGGILGGILGRIGSAMGIGGDGNNRPGGGRQPGDGRGSGSNFGHGRGGQGGQNGGGNFGSAQQTRGGPGPRQRQQTSGGNGEQPQNSLDDVQNFDSTYWKELQSCTAPSNRQVEISNSQGLNPSVDLSNSGLLDSDAEPTCSVRLEKTCEGCESYALINPDSIPENLPKVKPEIGGKQTIITLGKVDGGYAVPREDSSVYKIAKASGFTNIQMKDSNSNGSSYQEYDIWTEEEVKEAGKRGVAVVNLPPEFRYVEGQKKFTEK